MLFRAMIREMSWIARQKMLLLEGKNFHDHDFFRVLKFPAHFSVLNRWEKGREISKPGKNRGLESCTSIFFPLAQPHVRFRDFFTGFHCCMSKSRNLSRSSIFNRELYQHCCFISFSSFKTLEIESFRCFQNNPMGCVESLVAFLFDYEMVAKKHERAFSHGK